MEDSDTETIELSDGEAREIINALSQHQARTVGAEAERDLQLRQLLKREFGYEDEPSGDDETILDDAIDIIEGLESGHEIELSRGEAAEIDEALAETDPDRQDADVIDDLRDRFAETYDLDERR